MITVWRIVTREQLRNAFSGEGAASNGGRWNSPGTPVVYAAGSQSLAALEILVHTADPNALIDLGLVAIPVELNEKRVTNVSHLPRNWKTYPAPHSPMRLGDGWVRGKTSLTLRVPSVVVPSEWNYLLNPAHPDFKAVGTGKPRTFTFDKRLAVQTAVLKKW